MRRHFVLAVSLLILPACHSTPPEPAPLPANAFGFVSFGQSAFVDTDGDGLPDARLPVIGSEVANPGQPTFVDSDGDGLPDAHLTPANSFGFTSFGQSAFVDSDGDGLPDVRLPQFSNVPPASNPARPR